MDRECNGCGGTEWKELHEEEYSGHEHPSSSNDRRKRVLVCEECDSEGRVFDKGLSGVSVYAGAAR